MVVDSDNVVENFVVVVWAFIHVSKVVFSVTGIIVGECVWVVIFSVDISVVVSRLVSVSMVEEANCVSGFEVVLGLHALPGNVLRSYEIFVDKNCIMCRKVRCDVKVTWFGLGPHQSNLKSIPMHWIQLILRMQSIMRVSNLSKL